MEVLSETCLQGASSCVQKFHFFLPVSLRSATNAIRLSCCFLLSNYLVKSNCVMDDGDVENLGIEIVEASCVL